MHVMKRYSGRSLLAALIVPVLLMLQVSAVFAQENIATYPILPAGFSSIKVFDSQGRFAGRILPEKRYWVTIDRIPRFLQNAVVAVEDTRFYEHGGIDVRGIARALVKDVVKRRLAEGGSTITQQLIKNRYLSGAKTIERKLEEGRLALEFEKKYSKKQILEMYFNEIYYGNGAWGIAQAARLYFDKNPEELSDAECALLAGVQKAPGVYNPLGKPDKVSARRDVVLRRMVDVGMISQRQFQTLRNQHVAVIPPGQAPYYLAQIRGKLVERFGVDVVEQGGLEVTSAMDLNLQKLAEQALRDGVRRISPQLQGALVCLDPLTGNVLAAVGGTDFAKSPYNRAFAARRQPGSSIKPLIYTAALEKGLVASSLWDDTPAAYNRGSGASWKPLNYGRESYGTLSLRQALAYSNNVIAVKVLDSIGVPYFTEYAGKMGLMLKGNDLSMALGTEEVTLSDLVASYAPLANGGQRAAPRTIIRIYDRHRSAWIDNPPPVVLPAISPAAAYVATQMLKDVMLYGTAKNLKKFSLERAMAGKTGTTDDYKDAWFVGYTPQLVAGIWVGHDRPKSGGKGFTGGAIAAPIWERFMRQALAGRPVADFVRPDNVVSVAIDPTTGYLAAPDCPRRRDEFYLAGSEPKAYCPKHGGSAVDVLPAARSAEEKQPEPPAGQPDTAPDTDGQNEAK